MRRRPGLNPFLPIPPADQRRLSVLVNLALNELRSGQAEQALIDLRAAAVVSAFLLAGAGFSQDARQAVEAAAGVLDGAEAGTTTPEVAAAVCGPLVTIFEQLL